MSLTLDEFCSWLETLDRESSWPVRDPFNGPIEGFACATRGWEGALGFLGDMIYTEDKYAMPKREPLDPGLAKLQRLLLFDHSMDEDGARISWAGVHDWATRIQAGWEPDTRWMNRA